MQKANIWKSICALCLAILMPAQLAVAMPAQDTGIEQNSGEGVVFRSAQEPLTEEVKLTSAFFPDANFLAYLKTLPALRGVSEQNALTQEQLNSVTNIACPRSEIRSLEGIGYFPKLNYLYCDSNYLTTIDLSKNPVVSKLLFDGNPVSTLVLNPQSADTLISLSCWNTKLSTIDTSTLPALKSLVCGSSGLTTLDLSNNSELRSLTYYRGMDSTLDLSRVPELTDLIWSETPLEEIDFSHCPKLDYIGMRRNELSVLDLSSSGDCYFVSVPENRLISVHGNPNASYTGVDLRSQREYAIGVADKNGTFDMASLDPKFAQGTVSNLSTGTLNGSVLSDLKPGDKVSYTYTDGGLSVDARLSVALGNYWTVPVQMIGWTEGDAPNMPSGTPKYGTVTFTYGKAGGEFSSEIPTQAGEWICRATVPGGEDYGPLEENVAFTITPNPQTIPLPQNLTGIYRSTLGGVKLPEGYRWVYPSRFLSQDVGVHLYPAIYTGPEGIAVPLDIPVTIMPKNGELCTISPITNEYESQHIKVTDGTFKLVEGTDYTVTRSTEENLVTVVIDFHGNYYGSVTKTFTIRIENSWITPLSLQGWVVGQTPNTPIAEAKYGVPTFTYLVNGKYQNDPPTKAGTYTVRAVVPAGDYYNELTATAAFTIYSATAPDVHELVATYGDTLASVALPEGFSWNAPDTPVGDVGTKTFPATYTPSDAQYPGGVVEVSVKVLPKNGELCDISPITNEYESKHITIRDGDAVLKKGIDYKVSSSVKENVVTVTIDFMGNYYGSVTRTFTFGVENEWIVPLSIKDWVVGADPATPVAEPKYGTVQFTYVVNGKEQDNPPTKAGTYVVRATVPGTVYYPELRAEVLFRIYAGIAPEVTGLEAVYRQTLAEVELPEGFSWNSPNMFVGDVGVNAFAATYKDSARPAQPQYMGGTVELDVAVVPKNGALCDISPITNEYESKHITIMDGDYKLIKNVDYTVSSNRYDNLVSVAIQFENNYYNRVTRNFTFSFNNMWVEPVSIDSWAYGEPASEPEAAAIFGEPEFSYLVNGTYQSEPPTEVGSYEVEAVVPSTPYYEEIESKESFEITPALAPIPQGLTAVYRDKLRDVQLPDRYTWENPDQYVGDVGTHSFYAIYTPKPGDNYQGGKITIPVRVTPKDGRLCTCSPITNDYESKHIVITDGDYTLIKGLDYEVSQKEVGNNAVVTIVFIGNYYSSITRTYSHGQENYWVVPLSIENWRFGETPATPVAQAKYGTPAFSYLVNGKYVDTPPTEVGEYFVRATVPAGTTYKELTDETNFEILPAQSPTPSPVPSPTVGPQPTFGPVPTVTASPSTAPTTTASPSAEPTSTAVPSPTQGQSPAIAVKEGVRASIETDNHGKVLMGPVFTATTEGLPCAYILERLEIIPEGAKGTLRIVQTDGKVLSPKDTVSTNCKVQLVLSDKTIADELILVVRGDVNGSGIVNIVQLVAMAEDLNGVADLPWPYSLGAMFNANQTVDIVDLVMEARILNGVPLDDALQR